jgi:hypothetical protein
LVIIVIEATFMTYDMTPLVACTAVLVRADRVTVRRVDTLSPDQMAALTSTLSDQLGLA